ncbi:MAG: manganese efflux pump MntP family protein [Methanomicrobiaceae archaeon]|nr:manganese efflux pump MntP family protein [Methanomicrobiaceae archaeon]
MLVTSAITGVGLAMDCFAVSLAVGAARPAHRLETAVLLAALFGFFQGAMCILGWGVGFTFASLISAYDHWVAFFLLLFVGARMIREGMAGDERVPMEVLTLFTLTFLAVATSIDSLAVGISFAVIDLAPLLSALVIGLVSVFFSFAGVLSGTRLERILGKKVDILGGVILILLGVRVVMEHLS